VAGHMGGSAASEETGSSAKSVERTGIMRGGRDAKGTERISKAGEGCPGRPRRPMKLKKRPREQPGSRGEREKHRRPAKSKTQGRAKGRGDIPRAWGADLRICEDSQQARLRGGMGAGLQHRVGL